MASELLEFEEEEDHHGGGVNAPITPRSGFQTTGEIESSLVGSKRLFDSRNDTP